MFSILNKEIPTNKTIKHSFHLLYGINVSKAIKICTVLGFNPNSLLEELSDNQLKRLHNYILKKSPIEYHFKNKKNDLFQKQLKIRRVKAIRKQYGLPIHGQRTHTNANTCRKLIKRI